MNAIRTLQLIASNPKHLTVHGHTVLNAGVAECLQRGWIRYAPSKAVAYALTERGKLELSASR